MMLTRFLKGALFLASTAVAVPYTLAIVGNILYGWPQCKNKYRRAFSPKKVYNFNYTLYQMFRDKLKLVFLLMKWRKFYANADRRNVIKNIVYGRNDCQLDLYLPKQRSSKAKLPVIIYVYGGSWCSGDRRIYGLLCSELVKNANVIAVCPDYAYYPKGYVDDMIQDVVDCATWVIENIDEYGGDSNKIILMGHSAGAQLCAMAILEMLNDKTALEFQSGDTQFEDLKFAESYYGSRSSYTTHQDDLEDSSGSSDSFAVLSEHGPPDDSGASGQLDCSQISSSLLSSTNSEDFVMPKTELESISGTALGEGDQVERRDKEPFVNVTGNTEDEEELDDDSGDNDSIVTVRPKDIEGHLTLSEIRKSVKIFIGLAGVYSISDHYSHEFYRGVEDVSCMFKAVYGFDHFDRFSPTHVIKRLMPHTSMPDTVLIHGTGDFMIPVSSSFKFAEALSRIYANVKVRLVPECSHYEIVMDMMDKQRTYHNHIMNIVIETVNSIS